MEEKKKKESHSSLYLYRIVEVIIFETEKQIVKKDYTNLGSSNIYIHYSL